MRRILVTFVAGVAAALPLAAQDRVWTETGPTGPGFEEVDAAIRSFMQQWEVPGAAVAATYQGRLIFARGYTWDDPAVEPVQPTSLFRIASMSKPITSVAVHQLIEQGLLSYDTRIADALGLEPAPGATVDPWLAEVTVDHLLYHTGGWDRDLAFDPMFYDSHIAVALRVGRPISKHDIATFMTGQEMQFEPGSRYAYSNYGYALLGLLIEQVTGRDYSEWVAENVFHPIGVGRPRRGHTRSAEAAPGEVRYYAAQGENPYSSNIENMDAHGGWVLSAPDYARFMSALFDDPDSSPLLTRESIEAMVRTNPATSTAYGRGWTTFSLGGLQLFGHEGGLPGTVTNARWASDGLGIVALLNTNRTMGEFEVRAPGDLPEHDLFEVVGISASAIGAALAESWIPVVTSGSGVGDSLWRSDVAVLSRSPLPSPVRLRFEAADGSVDHELELPSGAQVIVEDVVAGLGLEGSGSLRVFSAEPVTVTSRTYNSSVDGTFGQFLAGCTGPGGLGNGDSAVLMHLREDELARSNLGVLNAGRRATEMRVELFDGSGASVVSFVINVAPRQVVQLNRPFADRGGRTDVGSGYAVLTVLAGEEVVVYGSVIDAGTNDPTTIPMKRGTGATRTFVAAAARAEGAAGSVWRTDLGLLNRSGSSTAVSVVLHRPGVDDLTLTVELGPGEQVVLDDVVGRLGGSGSGSLEVVAEGPVLVSSRTYNQGPAGTFGQYLDGEVGSLIGAGETVWLPQLQQNADFRTNVGWLNTGDEGVVTELRLFDHTGELVSTSRHTIGPGERLQLQEPFDRLAGRDDITSGYATVEVVAGSGVVVYASVIDNRTNDPTTVAMVR
jgi:CubicO group peptidase (beta-lactamase class C family)